MYWRGGGCGALAGVEVAMVEEWRSGKVRVEVNVGEMLWHKKVRECVTFGKNHESCDCGGGDRRSSEVPCEGRS